ncbi:MAG: leucine-rich repeat domain-containing protein, partial [Bacteroidales bacterium]|nr:leucine-rich repeat domain-containing protein [Bacteroidales bacterium]
MKKLWMLCGLLLAMAVCGKNQVFGVTPEGSDTVIMRFEKYLDDDNLHYNAQIAIHFFDDGVLGQKEEEFQGDPDYCVTNCWVLPIVMEIETDRGKSVQKTVLRGGHYSYFYGSTFRFNARFDDSLRGRDFSVKIYGYETGFRGFQEVLGLELNSCSLKEIDLQNCSFLRVLDVSDNFLTSLDLSHCPALSKLVCRSNLFDTLDINHPALSTLDCYNNQLTSLVVSAPLREFDCSYNSLVDSLDVNHPSLRVFNCSHNQLMSLDVSNCSSLLVLNCSYNQITSLEKNEALLHLDCRNNQLTSLNLDLGRLIYFDFSNNQVSAMSCVGSMRPFDEGDPVHRWIYNWGTCENLSMHNNSLTLSQCWEWQCKSFDIRSVTIGEQHVSLQLGIGEKYDIQSDMSLSGTTIDFFYNDEPIWPDVASSYYSETGGILMFMQPGEYTVKMENNFPLRYATVFLHIRVDGLNDPNDPNNPDDPNDPSAPDDPDDPNDPSAPGNPDNPTTSNEALDALPTAALQVYPNPATDALHVELVSSAASESLRAVRILSQSGHLCHSFGSGFDNLPVADLPAGLYFIEAETTTGTVLRQK